MARRRVPRDPLQLAPGIGPSLAQDLRDLGLRDLPDLAACDPEALYERLCALRGTRLDPCVLYAFRCAAYFARTPAPEPDLLAWWNWKGRTLAGLLLAVLVAGALPGCRTNDAPGADVPDAAETPDVPDAAAAPDTADAPDAGAFAPLSCDLPIPATPQSLGDKAAYFDALAQSLHVRPGQDLLWGAWLAADEATFEKVDMSDNVGSWTSIYSASQAFRYAATRSPEALDNLRRVMRGQRDMLRITGVKGLFTRVIVDPALPGFPTAAQLAAWYPDCDLSKGHCKRFNEVASGPYAGKWFKNDVSKDEYAAQLFAMTVAWDVVDDPEVRDVVREVALAVGDHLREHGLRIVDIDGQVTTYGRVYATGFDDFPGFNAGLALAWVKLAAAVGGGDAADWYRACLLQADGENPCIPDEAPLAYTEYLPQAGLDLDCKTNWNNHNMLQLAYYGLLRLEDDPGLRRAYQAALRDHVWDADDPRAMSRQQNTLYTFFYLVNRDPSDPWPTEAARDALCTMRRFPARKFHAAVDTRTAGAEVCTDRGGDPLGDVFVPIEQATMDNFQWSRNPWELESEAENRRIVESPEDYLLAYWMGRWYGFIRDGS